MYGQTIKKRRDQLHHRTPSTVSGLAQKVKTCDGKLALYGVCEGSVNETPPQKSFGGGGVHSGKASSLEHGNRQLWVYVGTDKQGKLPESLAGVRNCTIH